MFKEKFVRLCAERGVSPSSVVKKIGISSAAYSQWTEDTVPRKTTLLKISDYFGVDPSFFTEDQTKKDPASDVTELESKLLLLFRGVAEEDKEMLVDMIEAAFKNKNK